MSKYGFIASGIFQYIIVLSQNICEFENSTIVKLSCLMKTDIWDSFKLLCLRFPRDEKISSISVRLNIPLILLQWEKAVGHISITEKNSNTNSVITEWICIPIYKRTWEFIP